MNKLAVTLKQHTPLIHFQHNQEGATLRASEVKPKLDKYLIKHVFGDSFEKCKHFLVGYTPNNERILSEKFKSGFRALDYKLRIAADGEIDIKLEEQEKEEKGALLFKTESYPDAKNSLLLSSMGVPDKERLPNFSFYEKVQLVFSSKSDNLLVIIHDNIKQFISVRNFGGRETKGFGSFEVVQITEESNTFDPIVDFKAFFSLKNVDDESIGYKDIFRIVSILWGYVKDNALCVIAKIIEENDRVPSPVIFKPIIKKQKNSWEITIYILINNELFMNSDKLEDVGKLAIVIKKALMEKDREIRNSIKNKISHEILKSGFLYRTKL